MVPQDSRHDQNMARMLAKCWQAAWVLAIRPGGDDVIGGVDYRRNGCVG